MEVAQLLFEENAARKWCPAPTSSTLESPLQWKRYIIGQQSSPTPRHWLPQRFAAPVLRWRINASVDLGHVAFQPWPGTGAHDLELQANQTRSVPATPVARHIEDIDTALRLTRSQLAQALQVERATLYQWLRGAQPRAKTGERLEQLQQFATEWNRAGLGSARATWYLRVPGSEHTLGSLLMQDPLDLEQLRAYIRHAKQAPQEMEPAEVKPVYGFPADDRLEERRREGEFFPPTFSGSE